MARKFYIEDNEVLPAIKFAENQPTGFTLITNESLIHDLMKTQYVSRSEDGLNYYNNFRTDRYIDIINGIEKVDKPDTRVVVIKAPKGVKVWSAGHDVKELPTNAKDALKFYITAQALYSEVDTQDYAKGDRAYVVYQQKLSNLRTTLQTQGYQDYEMGYRK